MELKSSVHSLPKVAASDRTRQRIDVHPCPCVGPYGMWSPKTPPVEFKATKEYRIVARRFLQESQIGHQNRQIAADLLKSPRGRGSASHDQQRDELVRLLSHPIGTQLLRYPLGGLG